MKFMHLADLHIGKKLYERSLLDDQRLALDAVIAKAESFRPDAVFLAGDVYDRALPPTDAVALLDRFLSGLRGAGAKVFLIGGNHDSQERLGFLQDMLAREGVYIARPYAGQMERCELCGAHIYLLPYVRPKEAEPYFENMRFETTQQAVEAILARETIDPTALNVLLAHQFVTARGVEAERSESEIDPVGGESSVDCALFDAFDYVALGHLHAPQQVGRPEARYSGTPVKCSFSEARHRKSCVCGKLEKGKIELELFELPALHGMRDLKGTLDELLQNAEPSDDYVRAVLTDEVPPADPVERLSAVYPNLLRLELAPRGAAEAAVVSVRERDPMDLFAEFYETMNGAPISDEMLRLAAEAYQTANGEGER